MPRPRKVKPTKTVSESEQDRIRGLLIQHKEILRQVCEATNFWKALYVLAGAEVEAIDLIGIVCHYVCTGAIKIAKEDYIDLLEHRREKRVLATFGTEKAFDEFKAATREEKLAALQKTGIGVSILLRPIFNLPPTREK